MNAQGAIDVQMQLALDKLMKWADENKMEVAFDKTVEILFSCNSAEGGGKYTLTSRCPARVGRTSFRRPRRI